MVLGDILENCTVTFGCHKNWAAQGSEMRTKDAQHPVMKEAVP